MCNLIFQIEENINKFLQDESLQKHKFEPMEQVYRSIVYVLGIHSDNIHVIISLCKKNDIMIWSLAVTIIISIRTFNSMKISSLFFIFCS